jgi:hypothetical protein
MSFEAMTELVKPVAGSDIDFDRLVEQLLNEGVASLKPKDSPNSKITVSMVHSS